MNYEEIRQEFLNNYAKLLEIQYNDKPKAIATIKAHMEILLSNMLMWKIERECLNVDESEGVQLDIVGKWVGVDRYFLGQKFDNKRWYSYYDWNTASQPNNLQGSLQDWNNPTPENAPFLEYDWILSVTNRLNDSDFRILIKLKIAKNSILATAKNIDDVIKEIFNDLMYTTWTTFDSSRFTVVGAPVISENGEVSGFTVNDYIRTQVFSFGDSWEIGAKFTLKGELNRNNVLFFGGDSKQRFLLFGGQLFIFVSEDNTLEKLGTLRFFDQGTFKLNITYNLKIEYNNNEYKVSYCEAGAGDWITTSVKTTKKLWAANPNIWALGYGGGAQYAFGGSIFLDDFYVNINGQTMLTGSSIAPMQLTYNHAPQIGTIVNLAQEKACLPVPTGVNLTLKDYTNG